jgi:hypothetical protein
MKQPTRNKPDDRESTPKSGVDAGGVLSALTASAMALPGLTGLAGSASADSPVEETTVEGEYSYYREDNLRPHKAAQGPQRETERMEIHSYKFRVVTPVSERVDMEIDGGFETLSGASPWFVTPNFADRSQAPVQVMSGATIDENRGDMLLKGNYYFDSGKASATTGFSVEKDYYSVNFGFGGDYSVNDKNTTFSAGAGVSLDWIEPTDCRTMNRVCSEDKQSYSVYAGISQVVTRHSAIQSTLSFTYTEGFLSDPYKLAYIDTPTGAILPDTRPSDRKQFTWLTKYRHHVSAFNGTAHFDYRLYVDDWSVNSHTFDLAWYQSLPYNIQIIPSIRYYSQSQADFYEVFYDDFRNDGFYSSDYRLSPYGAFAYRIKATMDFEDLFGSSDWQIAASYERYRSSDSLAFQRVDIENPGLVTFRVFAGRITVKF